MGATGMGDMMDMGKPRNSMFMAGGEGPFGSIFMGGMFTILKVRERLSSYDEDPGWYEHPPGTQATAVAGKPPRAAAPAPFPPPRIVAIGPDTPFQAVKAGSCASMAGAPRR
jgi:hypothetical protein